ncbi:MAG: peptidoglycan-binding protein [Candidatus Pacebacteria bacterium]|nr:peptidoglycan-binding protein [Candidatus Paceibacterota bacterium]
MNRIKKGLISIMFLSLVFFSGKVLFAEEPNASELKLQILQLLTQLQAQIISLNGGTPTPVEPLVSETGTFVLPKDTLCYPRYQGQLEITIIQQELKDQGYAIEKVDGKLGPNTLAAVKAFQTKANITVDGKIGKETRRALSSGSILCMGDSAQISVGDVPFATENNTLCYPRYQGQLEITTIQQELKDQGYAIEKVDGKLGPNTLAAVKAFQTKANITVDGKIGKETRRALTLGSLSCDGVISGVTNTPAESTAPFVGPLQPEGTTGEQNQDPEQTNILFKKNEISSGTRSSSGSSSVDTGVFTFTLSYEGSSPVYISSNPEQAFSTLFFNQSGNPVSSSNATLSIASNGEKITQAGGSSWYRLSKGNTLALRASILPGSGNYYAELFRLSYTTENIRNVQSPNIQNVDLTPTSAWRSAIITLNQ